MNFSSQPAPDNSGVGARGEGSGKPHVMPPLLEREHIAAREGRPAFGDCGLLVQCGDFFNVPHELLRGRILNVVRQLTHSRKRFIQQLRHLTQYTIANYLFAN
jgi:hypothetical protein